MTVLEWLGSEFCLVSSLQLLFPLSIAPYEPVGETEVLGHVLEVKPRALEFNRPNVVQYTVLSECVYLLLESVFKVAQPFLNVLHEG